jgi:hypothetical protein
VCLVSKLVTLSGGGSSPATPDVAWQNLGGWDVKGERVILAGGEPVTTLACRSWTFKFKVDPTYSGFSIPCLQLMYCTRYPSDLVAGDPALVIVSLSLFHVKVHFYMNCILLIMNSEYHATFL